MQRTLSSNPRSSPWGWREGGKLIDSAFLFHKTLLHTHILLHTQISLPALLPFSSFNCILNKCPLKKIRLFLLLHRPDPPTPRSLTLLDFPAAMFHPEPCLLVFCFQIVSPAICATFKMLTVQNVIYRTGAFAPEN